MHTVVNLFGVPAAGAVLGAFLGGPVGLAVGMMGGWALGIIVDDHAGEDTRVEQLERRVRELEAELERRGDDSEDE